MKKLLGIVVLGLLWCNVGFASDAGGIREPGTDEKCFYVFERENIFKKKFLPKVNKDKGIFVTYVGCNKYYDDWSWDYSLNIDLDAAHKKAYQGCVGIEMPKYNLTGCHLFSINDVIVWGKDAAFVAKVEKEIKEGSATVVAENVEELNKNCIRKGTTEFNKKVKQLVKKNFVTVMYFGCKSMGSWYWHQSTEEDLDTSREVAYKKCLKGASEHKIENCHLFSINDTIVYGKDAAFVAKVEKETKKKKIVEKPKKKKTVKKLKFNEPTINPFDKKKKYLPGSTVYSYALENDYIFRKEDPTTLKKLTFKKERSVRVKDCIWSSGKCNDKIRNMRAFSFIAEYEENIKLKIFIEYNHKDKKISKENQKLIAEKKALYFSRMFGQMPYFLKIYTKKIYVYRNDGKSRPWWVPWKLSGQAWVLAPEFHLAESRCGYYVENMNGRYDECAETMIHELAHVVNYKTKLIKPSKWLKARKLDKYYCSNYAKENSVEDFAESVMCWIGVRYKSHKMLKGNVKKINQLIPNRLKFFDELNLKVHPLK